MLPVFCAHLLRDQGGEDCINYFFRMFLPFGVNKECKLEARMNLISIFVKTTEPNKWIHLTRAAYLKQKVGMFHGMKSVYHTLMNCLLLQDQLIIWPIYFLFFSWLLSRLK